MNHFVNLSQQYGPGIAQQAMAAVSLNHLHKSLTSCTRVSVRAETLPLDLSQRYGPGVFYPASHGGCELQSPLDTQCDGRRTE